MRIPLYKILALFAMTVFFCFPAHAQEQEGIAIGQWRLLPTLGLSYGHDDNITLASKNEQDSDFYVISPGIRLEAPTDRSLFSITAEAEWSRYEDSSLDDSDDWGIRAEWVYDPTSRTNMGLFAGWKEGHDRRGEGSRQGDESLLEIEPDEYEQFSYGATWSYGAVGARGRLELDYFHSDLDYTNNEDYTRFRDREDDHLEGAFFWRVRPKTSLLVGAGWTDIDYDAEVAPSDVPDYTTLDSEEIRYFIGVTWDVSARTSGRLDYGVLDKDFDVAGREDYDNDFWRGSIEWRPRTYSTFTFTTSRETEETDGFGDYILREDHSLIWTHRWTTKFNTNVEYGIGEDDHRGGTREDDLTYYGISARYQLNQYLQFGAGWKFYERDSNESQYNYEQNVWLLTLEGSL